MQQNWLLDALDNYERQYSNETTTVARFRELLTEEPRCFERDCWRGHITGSAWLLDPTEEAVLLTHHKKLDIWVQLGGHSDGDADTLSVARREAEEESGVAVEAISAEIFDLDIHNIPARKNDPAHFHYDVRFALRALSRDVVVSDESHDLAWVRLLDLERYSAEVSILRMRDKWVRSAI